MVEMGQCGGKLYIPTNIPISSSSKNKTNKNGGSNKDVFRPNNCVQQMVYVHSKGIVRIYDVNLDENDSGVYSKFNWYSFSFDERFLTVSSREISFDFFY